MEIRRVGLNAFDQQSIQAIQREMARSIKPNVFREIPEEVQLALWLTDLVQLSAEAKELLKKVRNGNFAEIEESGWLALLEELQEQIKGQTPASNKNGDPRLNLISLPIMRPPLEEVLPRDESRKEKKGAERQTPLRQLIAGMIVKSTRKEVTQRLIDELEPLGIHFIQACKTFGVHLLVLAQKERLSQIKVHQMSLIVPGERTDDGRLKDAVRGMYFEDRRLIVLGEEQIGVPGHLTSVHELAHAYDHAFSEEHHRLHHLSTQLWNLFGKSRKKAITDYAATKPAEYFAESVEAYFLEANRMALKANDPQMFEYLQNLFQL